MRGCHTIRQSVTLHERPGFGLTVCQPSGGVDTQAWGSAVPTRPVELRQPVVPSPVATLTAEDLGCGDRRPCGPAFATAALAPTSPPRGSCTPLTTRRPSARTRSRPLATWPRGCAPRRHATKRDAHPGCVVSSRRGGTSSRRRVSLARSGRTHAALSGTSCSDGLVLPLERRGAERGMAAVRPERPRRPGAAAAAPRKEASEASQGGQLAAQSRRGGESFPGAPGARVGCAQAEPRGGERAPRHPPARPGDPAHPGNARPEALSHGRARPLG